MGVGVGRGGGVGVGVDGSGWEAKCIIRLHVELGARTISESW